MAYNDPWAWANEQDKQVPQMSNNSIPAMGSGQQSQAPAPIQGQPGIGQMAGQILTVRGVNQGIDAGVSALTPSKLAPVVDSSAPVLTEQGAAAATNTAPLSAATTATTATEVGGTTAAAVEGATVATAGTTAATGAGVAGAGAATTGAAATGAAGAGAAGAGTAAGAAPMLAAMGPVGWGVGALLLAKQMKWI